MSDRPVALRFVHLRRLDDAAARVVVDVHLPDDAQPARFVLRTDDGTELELSDDGRVRHAFDLPLARGEQVRLFLVSPDDPRCDWCLAPPAPERTGYADVQLPTAPGPAGPLRPGRGRRRAREVGVVGSLAALLLLAAGTYTAAAWWGRGLAREALALGAPKTAIAVHVAGAEGGEPVGFVYGRRIGGSPDVFDKYIPVRADALVGGEAPGHLHLWYEATKALEDTWHDEPFGIHPRLFTVLPGGAIRYVLNRLGGSYQVHGGSSLSDQTCGRLRADTSAVAAKSRARIKIEEIACGIGLRHLRSPEEIGALYATYAPLSVQQGGGVELFARLFWGFEGTTDPRLTRGHQLVLASMARLRWDSSEALWPRIEARANEALDALIAEGVVPEADRPGIEAEISAAKPLRYEDVKRAPGGVDLSPSDRYDFLVSQAVRELGVKLGEDWRAELEAITLTVEPAVQEALHDGCERALRHLPDEAVCSGLVVDGRGRAVAAHVANRSGALELDLLGGAMVPPGSLGKLFLASDIAGTFGVDPAADARLAAFEADLTRSRPSIVARARALGVSEERVGEMIRCFGEERAESDGDAIRHAALGDWRTNAYAFLPYLAAASTGTELPSIHVLAEGRSRTDEPVPLSTAPIESRAPRCTELAWAGGHAARWLALPLRPGGTLHHLEALADGGKTGTVPPVRDGRSAERGTSATFAVTTVRLGDDWYGGFFSIGIPSDPSLDLGDAESGSRTAGVVAAPVLQVLHERRMSAR